jgi:hypothetical protein
MLALKKFSTGELHNEINRRRAEKPLLDEIEREIDEAGMDIPEARRRDPHWLARNAGIRNTVGEKFRKLLANYAKVSGPGTEE